MVLVQRWIEVPRVEGQQNQKGSKKKDAEASFILQADIVTI